MEESHPRGPLVSVGINKEVSDEAKEAENDAATGGATVRAS